MQIRSVMAAALAVVFTLPFDFAANAQAPAPSSNSDLDSLLGPSPAAAGDTGTASAAPAATPPIAPAPQPAAAPTVNTPPTPIAPEAAAATPDAATAAAVPARSAEKKSNSRLVEEIIVTAQKREENLRDVPISVAAFSGAALDARGIVEPKDLQRITPGLTESEQAGFAVTFLRGVGSDAYLMADPSVNLYIDGVYFPFAHGLGQALGALQRVEVEKGPQGTLFGRNAIGGAINVITKDPGGDPETTVQASYARYDQMNTRVYANVPITDDLAFSISGLYNTENSYYDGTVSGGAQPLPKEIEEGARFKVKWKPFDNTDLLAAAFIVHQQGERTMFAPNDKPFPLFQEVIKPQTGYNNVSVDAPSYFTQDAHVIYGQVHSHFDWFDVKALASRQNAATPSEYDFDGSPTPLATFDAHRLYANSDSAEFQIISNDTSWGSNWLKWIGGFYYFSGVQGFDPVFLNVAGTDLASGTLFGVNLTQTPALGGLVTQALKLLDGLPLPIPSGSVRLEGVLGTKSYAGYLQTTVKFTDWIGLTLGGRYTDETRSIVKSNSQLQTVSGGPVQLLDFDTGQSATLKKFSPKISLDAHPFDDATLLYASWQEATKSGTYNVINIYQPAQYVPPETLRAIELGVKTQLFDGAVQLNAAAFNYQDTNLQVQVISLLNGGAVSFESARGARIRGADFDTVVQILPNLVDGLVFTGSAAYLNAVYTSFYNGSGFDPSTGIFQHAAYDFTGHPIAHTPTFSGNFGLSKTFNIGPGSLELASDIYLSSHYWFFPQDTDYSRQNSYHLVNAHISYLYDPWKTRITVFGENLTETRYSVGQFLADFGRLDYLNRPISAGVRLNWSF